MGCPILSEKRSRLARRISARIVAQRIVCAVKRLLILQTEPLDAEAAAWLARRCELVECAPTDARFRGLLACADGLVVRTYTLVNQELLASAPRLRVVARAGVGLDNIDLEACAGRGIPVVSTPDANTQAVVEYVVCLLADALRPRLALIEAVNGSEWNRLRATVKAPTQMSDRRLGILGLGRIGRRVAQVARAIGCETFYSDLLNIPEYEAHGAMSLSVDELFRRCDIITLHIDGRPSNRNFVGPALLDRMPSDVVLINTSRGMILDNAALANFLKHHPAARAMIDVHEPEPFGPDYPLLGLPNATLLPHLASRTDPALKAMSWVVRDVARILALPEPVAE